MFTVSIFVGDIADADADAICTSTNPRLSLVMGTGGSVRSRGGFAILKACEELLETEVRRGGAAQLSAGTAVSTVAGRLPQKVVIHCVASDAAHRSSPAVIAACVRNALRCARENGCRRVAMPVFASGHAHVRFDQAVQAMAMALKVSDPVDEVILVVLDHERATEASAILRWVLGMEVGVKRSSPAEDAEAGWLTWRA